MQPHYKKYDTPEKKAEFARKVDPAGIQKLINSLMVRRAQAVAAIDDELKFYKEITEIKAKQAIEKVDGKDDRS